MKSNIDGEGVVLAAVVPTKAIYTNADSLEEWGFSGDRELLNKWGKDSFRKISEFFENVEKFLKMSVQKVDGKDLTFVRGCHNI